MAIGKDNFDALFRGALFPDIDPDVLGAIPELVAEVIDRHGPAIIEALDSTPDKDRRKQHEPVIHFVRQVMELQ